jgi:formylglycine-generating enzyme required for sulfatase activity
MVVSMLIATSVYVHSSIRSSTDLDNLIEPEALFSIIGYSLPFAGLWAYLVLKSRPPDAGLGKRSDDIRKLELNFSVLIRMVVSVLVSVLASGAVIMLLTGVYFSVFPRAVLHPWLWNVSPSPLTAEQEQALKPREKFKEGANCPDMVVVPAGDFIMGSPAEHSEGPQHKVTIRQRFAVGKYELTGNEWNACAAHGGCPLNEKFLRFFLLEVGVEPVTMVSWSDAQRYVAWIVKVTGKPYRLLSEAEWEYAARADKTTAYFWGDEIGNGHANCTGCGSHLGRRLGFGVVRVGSFTANDFGLHDMHGNVNEWVEDCRHSSYEENPPTDGSAWTAEGDCSFRVVRGGSWSEDPRDLRSAARGVYPKEDKHSNTGFRVGRPLTP